MRIALAGNPNSGKTTTFNALTGRNEHVGNWAGVTVEKKAYPIKKNLCGAKVLFDQSLEAILASRGRLTIMALLGQNS